MKKILLSLLVIAGASLVWFAASGAFFSDTEVSKDNVLSAGSLDLKIDNTSYYNGATSSATTWGLADLPGHLFFDFKDIKPDDEGEDTISLHAENDYWACMDIKTTKNDDNTCTEPEKLDDPNCAEPGENLGELGGLLNFVWWADDGDNVLEADETPFINVSTASVALNQLIALADSKHNIWGTPGPLSPETTYYIGKAWCFGNLTLTPVADDQGVNPTVDPGVDCDGTLLNNASQTDQLMADVEFSAVQARHNPDFQCGPGGTPFPSVSPSASPLACGKADVMLVLDRSGSIGADMSLLKTAAKAFVDALGLTDPGVHAGQTSFADTGSLDHNLTFNSNSLKATIDALVSFGWTNLKDGIELATGELSGGNDRDDGTSPDKMLIITDGHPNRPLPSDTADDLAKAAADAARAAGSEVFVVGVGSGVNAAYLQTVADDAGHYYSAGNYSGLQTILENLDLCNGG